MGHAIPILDQLNKLDIKSIAFKKICETAVTEAMEYSANYYPDGKGDSEDVTAENGDLCLGLLLTTTPQREYLHIWAQWSIYQDGWRSFTAQDITDIKWALRAMPFLPELNWKHNPKGNLSQSKKAK